MREEKRGSQPRGEKRPFPLRNPKSCIPHSFLLVVQQICKSKLVFLVVRTRKPSDFKNCEIYFILSFLFSLMMNMFVLLCLFFL